MPFLQNVIPVFQNVIPAEAGIQDYLDKIFHVSRFLLPQE